VRSYYDEFRQSREIIKERVAPFIGYFRSLSPVVDIGCGRGEFLELLKENDIEGRGVDSDPDMVKLCRDFGLDVEEKELFDFLGELDGCGGLFISHVIEHMDGISAERMIELGFNSLGPGGRMAIITPNPENISVMTKAFWLDPTHVRPYPLMLLGAMLKEQGFRIMDSGGAPGTMGNIKFRPIRRILAKTLLPWLGLGSCWEYLHSAQDIFIVGEKS